MSRKALWFQMKKPVKFAPKFRRIKPVSAARAKQNAEYERLKRIERRKPENQICCVFGCNTPSGKNPHHRNGREKKMLCIVEFWRWPCDPHHERVKRDPHWARANDLLPRHGHYNTTKS